MVATVGGTSERFRPLVDLYRKAGTSWAHPETSEVGVHAVGSVGESDPAARKVFFPSSAHLNGRIGREHGWPTPREQFYAMASPQVAFLIGDRATVAAKMLHASKVLGGVSRIMFQMSTALLEAPAMKRSMELLGTEVAPSVQVAIHDTRKGDLMTEASLGQIIAPAVVLMGAAVVAVPLFRRLGLGSVLGYFAAGVLVGPSVLGLFADAQSTLHFSELGVVMFLFLIGLELRPPKLWAMRSQIFGLGLTQVACAIAALALTGAVVFGLPGSVAFIAGSGFVLSSTAVIMSALQDRGEMSSPEGQKSVAILLFEDLMIVPLLAMVAVLSPFSHGQAAGWTGILVAVAALSVLLAVSRWGLNPFFTLLARARTREVLTAGALLVVLGTALLMEVAGLSMAMGAFLAGVMLSSSSYRHQIESDIEPFRGLLMGLFFLAVGMSLDLAIVAGEWRLLLSMLAAFTVAKGAVVYAVARLSGGSSHQALHRTSMFLQGGEFAFVLYAAATSGGVIDARENALFSTVVILSMALTPLLMIATDKLLRAEALVDDVDVARDLKGRVLLIGFGRFGQIASQALLSKGVDLAVIDKDPDRIRDAARYGFKVFFGDGVRLDILHHSGTAEVDAIMICIDDPKSAMQIVELAQHEFPQAKLLVRSYDRGHAVELIRAGVDYQIRETVESAYLMGAGGLRALGFAEVDIKEAAEDIRRRDHERLAEQVQGDAMSGSDRLHIQPVPEPLGRSSGQSLSQR